MVRHEIWICDKLTLRKPDLAFLARNIIYLFTYTEYTLKTKLKHTGIRQWSTIIHKEYITERGERMAATNTRTLVRVTSQGSIWPKLTVNRPWNETVFSSFVIYHSICPNSFSLWIILKEENPLFFVEYWINF